MLPQFPSRTLTAPEFAKQENKSVSKAFTLIEVLVVLTLLGLLAALLFPAFASARRKAQDSSCLGNLRQLGLAVRMYADDYDGLYPHALNPDELSRDHDRLSVYSDDEFHRIPAYTLALKPYVKSLSLFRCPRDSGGDYFGEQVDDTFAKWGTSYSYNRVLLGDYLVDRSGILNANASKVAVFYDNGDWHDDGANPFESDKYIQVVFADSHTKRMLRHDLNLWILEESKR